MTSWDPALAAGLCANRPAMRFDWRGAGMSEKIRGHFDIDVMCADIAGIVKETGFGAGKPVDVVGIALGGGCRDRFGGAVPGNGPPLGLHQFSHWWISRSGCALEERAGGRR